MKQILFRSCCLILICGFFTGCSIFPNNSKTTENTVEVAEITSPTSSEMPPTLTPTLMPTETPTALPTPTETLTPTPTTPAVNLGGEVITAENLAELDLIDTIGKGEISYSGLGGKGRTYVVKTPRGLFLYDLATMEEHAFLENYGDFHMIPDSSQMVAVSPEETLQVFDLSDGSTLQEMAAENVIRIGTVSFSKDAKMMAVAVTQEHETRQDYLSYRIDVWNLEENKLVSQLRTDLDRSCSVLAFSDDHSQLATKCSEYIFNWDVEAQSIIWSLKNEGSITAFPFSSDGEYIATYTTTAFGDPGEVMIRYTSNGAVVGRVPGQLNPNAFSPDSKHIVTSSFSLIRVWNIFSSQAVKKIETDLHWPNVYYSDDGKYLLANDGQLAWTIEDYEAYPDYPGPEVDYESIASINWSELGYFSDIKDIVMLEDQSLFIWGFSRGYAGYQESSIWWFDPVNETYQEISIGTAKGEPAMSPLYDQVAICTEEGLSIINMQDGTSQIIRPCHKGYTSLAFSKDAKKLYGAVGILIDVVDLETGESISQMRGHTHNIGAIRISEEGDFLFSTSSDPVGGGYEVAAWGLDPITLIRKWTLPVDYYSSFTDALFTSDGAIAIAIFNEVTVWRLSDGWYLDNFPGLAVGLSPDGALAAVSSSGTSFQFYDPADWSLLASIGKDEEKVPVPFMDFSYYDSRSGVQGVKFLNGGRVLACVRADGVITLWGVP